MILHHLSQVLVAFLTFGALPGANAAAVARGNVSSLATRPGSFPAPVIRPVYEPYSDDPAFNPHMNAPDISSDELCRRGKTLEDIDANGNGNWYCQQVDQVVYKKVTSSGPYDEVVFMDDQTGTCNFKPRNVQGELGPFNEPVSLVFRGPLRLKQFSIYLPNGDGSFHRTGEYHAASQTRSGIMFLGNYGGQGSGVAANHFGASLSYVRPDGRGGASGPSTIHDAQLVSHSEFIVTTDQPCDDTCGYRRPGAVTYKGFPGSSRVFLFEFAMPDEPEHNNDADTNGNKPAIWLVNSRIPNTAQYNSCNCWATGCGEFDIFEILAPGQKKAETTFHLGPDQSGGDANWFPRPFNAPIKLAVVFETGDRGTTSVKNLGTSNGARFGGSLSAAEVDGFKSHTGLVSEFTFTNHG